MTNSDIIKHYKDRVTDNSKKIWREGAHWRWGIDSYISGLMLESCLTEWDGSSIGCEAIEHRCGGLRKFAGVTLDGIKIVGLDMSKIRFMDSSITNVEFINCELSNFAYHESVHLDNLTFTGCTGSLVEVCNSQIGKHMLSYLFLEHKVKDGLTLPELIEASSSNKSDKNLGTIRVGLSGMLRTYYKRDTSQVDIGSLLIDHEWLLEYTDYIDKGLREAKERTETYRKGQQTMDTPTETTDSDPRLTPPRSSISSTLSAEDKARIYALEIDEKVVLCNNKAIYLAAKRPLPGGGITLLRQDAGRGKEKEEHNRIAFAPPVMDTTGVGDKKT